jgi:hypothetical protein
MVGRALPPIATVCRPTMPSTLPGPPRARLCPPFPPALSPSPFHDYQTPAGSCRVSPLLLSSIAPEPPSLSLEDPLTVLHPPDILSSLPDSCTRAAMAKAPPRVTRSSYHQCCAPPPFFLPFMDSLCSQLTSPSFHSFSIHRRCGAISDRISHRRTPPKCVLEAFPACASGRYPGSPPHSAGRVAGLHRVPDSPVRTGTADLLP